MGKTQTGQLGWQISSLYCLYCKGIHTFKPQPILLYSQKKINHYASTVWR